MKTYQYYNNATGMVKSKERTGNNLVVTVGLKTGELASSISGVNIPITFIIGADDMKTWYATSCASTSNEAEYKLTFTGADISSSDEIKYMAMNTQWELRLTATELNDFVEAINNVNVATDDVAGIVKIGDGLQVTEDGTASVNSTVVRTSGNQTINGRKTFIINPAINNDYPACIIQNSALTDATTPDEDQRQVLSFTTSSGLAAANRTGHVESITKTDGSRESRLSVYSNNSTHALASVSVLYPASGNPYATAPTPPDGDESTKIATTQWVANNAPGVPAGAVMPFYNVTLGGTDNRNPIFWGETTPDTGWLVCDGGSDGQGGNVPDLSSRFIYGTVDPEQAGQTGGASSVTPSITVGATTLTVETMPSHTHGASTHANNGGGAFGGGIIRDNTTRYTFATGGSQAHTHPATASSSIETIPPYYTLVYCVKLI